MAYHSYKNWRYFQIYPPLLPTIVTKLQINGHFFKLGYHTLIGIISHICNFAIVPRTAVLLKIYISIYSVLQFLRIFYYIFKPICLFSTILNSKTIFYRGWLLEIVPEMWHIPVIAIIRFSLFLRFQQNISTESGEICFFFWVFTGFFTFPYFDGFIPYKFELILCIRSNIRQILQWVNLKKNFGKISNFMKNLITKKH